MFDNVSAVIHFDLCGMLEGRDDCESTVRNGQFLHEKSKPGKIDELGLKDIFE